MNLRRGFRRVTLVLAVIGAVVGSFGFFVLGGVLGMDYAIWWWLLFTLLGAPVGYCGVWLIYYLLEWLVLGFRGDKG